MLGVSTAAAVDWNTQAFVSAKLPPSHFFSALTYWLIELRA